MKKLFKLFLFALMVGGWALAGAAVHLVRSPQGPLPRIGNLTLVTKDRLTYKETYIDTAKWSEADVASHPKIAEKLKLKTGVAVVRPASNDGGCEFCDDGAKSVVAAPVK